MGGELYVRVWVGSNVLCEAANLVVLGEASEEKLISAAMAVSSSTQRLLIACRCVCIYRCLFVCVCGVCVFVLGVVCCVLCARKRAGWVFGELFVRVWVGSMLCEAANLVVLGEASEEKLISAA